MMAEKVSTEGKDWAPLVLWKPCHLFWAAYENKVGLGAGFYSFSLTQEQFLQVKPIL